MSTILHAANVLAVRVWTTDGDQAAVNTIHYQVTAVAGSSITDSDAAAAFDERIEAPYKAVLTTSSTYNGVQVSILTTPPAATVNHVVQAGPGTVEGDTLPRQTCGLISYYTNLGGRKYRGRNYIAFPPELYNETGTGTPTSAYKSLLLTLAEALCFELTVTVGSDQVTLTPVIYHEADKLTTDITSRVPRQKWATQRRRGSYGRPNASPI